MIAPQSREMPRRSGFTLLELLVVLILMGLVAALVAPALLPHHHDQSALNALLGSAREVAAQRGEVVNVHIDPTGEWRMEAGAAPLQASLASGRIQPFFHVAVTLMVSPLGSCGFDVRSAAALGARALDPLTCEMRAR
jgi:prepilin-type N-terminal cleavage/methylation domain-containing protein